MALVEAAFVEAASRRLDFEQSRDGSTTLALAEGIEGDQWRGTHIYSKYHLSCGSGFEPAIFPCVSRTMRCSRVRTS